MGTVLSFLLIKFDFHLSPPHLDPIFSWESLWKCNILVQQINFLKGYIYIIYNISLFIMCLSPGPSNGNLHWSLPALHAEHPGCDSLSASHLDRRHRRNSRILRHRLHVLHLCKLFRNTIAKHWLPAESVAESWKKYCVKLGKVIPLLKWYIMHHDSLVNDHKHQYVHTYFNPNPPSLAFTKKEELLMEIIIAIQWTVHPGWQLSREQSPRPSRRTQQALRSLNSCEKGCRVPLSCGTAYC